MDKKGEAITLAWEWPGDQCISYKVTPEVGGLLRASSVAKQLLALSKILEASEDGIQWMVMLRGIYTNTDGSLQFDLGVAPKASPVTRHNCGGAT